MSSFEGFGEDTFRFLEDLSENNDRDWFAQNRERYEQHYLAAAQAFIAEIEKPLARSAPLLQVSTKKVGGSLMRIYKDVRFSKDKTPYKTNIGIHFRHSLGRDVHAPGLYLHIATDECFFGAGIWRPPTAVAKAIRDSIDERASEWRRIVARPTFKKHFELYDDRLKTVPRGFAKDHPQIDDLRLKSFIGMAKLSRKQVQQPQLVQEVARLTKLSSPLMAFICEALEQPY